MSDLVEVELREVCDLPGVGAKNPTASARAPSEPSLQPQVFVFIFYSYKYQKCLIPPENNN